MKIEIRVWLPKIMLTSYYHSLHNVSHLFTVQDPSIDPNHLKLQYFGYDIQGKWLTHGNWLNSKWRVKKNWSGLKTVSSIKISYPKSCILAGTSDICILFHTIYDLRRCDRADYEILSSNKKVILKRLFCWTDMTLSRVDSSLNLWARVKPLDCSINCYKLTWFGKFQNRSRIIRVENARIEKKLIKGKIYRIR